MARHLLVLSVSAGNGHVRAADAVCAAARAAHHTATHLDLLTLVPKEFRKLYAGQYLKLVDKLPQLWAYLYSKSDRPSRDTVLGKLKRLVEKVNRFLLSDLAVCCELSMATVRCAVYNVRANLPDVTDPSDRATL